MMLLPGGPGQGGLDALLGAVELDAPCPTTTSWRSIPAAPAIGALRCKALKRGSQSTAPERCARELGPRRGYYRSYDTVEDVEASAPRSGPRG